jgi:hypothetical protein
VNFIWTSTRAPGATGCGSASSATVSSGRFGDRRELELGAADLHRLDGDPAPAGVRGLRAAQLAARAAHEQRRVVLERVEIEVERQRVDRALAGVEPGQGLRRRDLVARDIELRVDLVARDARRARRTAAAECGAGVGLWQRPHTRRAGIAAASDQGDRDDGGAVHAPHIPLL